MTEIIVTLTKLLALHGVYALTIIFIFYQQARAYQQYKSATAPEDRRYFRRVHTATLIATFVLASIASWIWWYENFSFKPFYWGAIVNMEADRHRDPMTVQDPPFVEASLSSEDPDVEVYVDKRPYGSDKQQLGWVIRYSHKPTVIRLHLLHSFAVREYLPLARQPGRQASESTRLNSSALEGQLTIPLSTLGYGPSNPIWMDYRPDSREPIKRLGRIFLRRESKDSLVPWDTMIEPHDSQLSLLKGSRSGFDWWSWLVRPAGAQSLPDSFAFSKDGSYDRTLGVTLREGLGSRDFRRQLAARNFVVAQGSRSSLFIRESLEEKASKSVEDRSLMFHNLVEALDRIEEKEHTRFPDLWLRIALTSYGASDFASASRAFQHVDSASIGSDALLWYYQGYAHYESGLYTDALTSLKSYVAHARSNSDKSDGHLLMGLIHEALSQPDSAITEYQFALLLTPNSTDAQNNLAYEYAQQNERLSLALELVNRALTKHPTDANYLDTKAWILYRLGTYDEALSAAQRATALLPNDRVIIEHLDSIRHRAKKP